MIVRIEDGHKFYGHGSTQVHALRGVDLAIAPGEFVTVMGPSGSGKSTLLHVLGCLDHLSRGRYLFEGRDVNTFSDRRLSEVRNRRIGFVFQSFNLLTRETALENVTLPLLYAGVPGAMQRGRELLRAVGLGDRMHHYPGQLSGGEQQRVAIARALVKHPALLLADEPTGNLDSQSGKQILDLINELRREELTILLITHDPAVAARGDRTLRLQDGQLSADGRGA